jgi:hypothetical protein
MSRRVVLNVAEKNSVARAIAEILSGSQSPASRQGRSRFQRI